MSTEPLCPLVVDLDGTLILTDLLHESVMALLRQAPLEALKIPIWLAQGKARLKAELARRVNIDPATLPYNQPFLAWLRMQQARGRRLILATASDERLAKQVADHLGLFEAVLASDGKTNLAGPNKRQRLVADFGLQGYAYAGNSNADLAVWQGAATAVVVNARPSLGRQAARSTPVEHEQAAARAGWAVWGKALRLHQWLKNLLIFIPLLAAHKAQEAPLLMDALAAFLAFSLTASSVYLLNDLLDLGDDRHHRSKRLRPFAAGTLSIASGVLIAPALLVLSGLLAAWLGKAFVLALLSYYLLTLAYSFWLKRQVMLDVITLAALYTLRIIAGAAAVGVRPSFWLLAFSMFIFLSLALLKRYAELLELRRAGGLNKARGRGYHVEDLALLMPLGASAGCGSVLVLALYLNSSDVISLYREPRYIWLACPALLYWISRAWLLAHRGEMHEDPVVFAARDRISRCVALGLAVMFWLAL